MKEWLLVLLGSVAVNVATAEPATIFSLILVELKLILVGDRLAVVVTVLIIFTSLIQPEKGSTGAIPPPVDVISLPLPIIPYLGVSLVV